MFVPGETLHRELDAGAGRRAQRRQQLDLRPGPRGRSTTTGRPISASATSGSAARRPAGWSASTPTRSVPRLATPTTCRATASTSSTLTYGQYAGRYNEAQIGDNNNVGNPDLLLGHLHRAGRTGPQLRPGFQSGELRDRRGQFPTENIFFEDGLSSPIVKEFTASYGVDLFNGRGYVEGTYVHRDFGTSSRTSSTSRTARRTSSIGRVRRRHVHEHHLSEHRRGAGGSTEACCSRAGTTSANRWTVNGHYTLQLKNDGNYEGEGANSRASPSRIGDYPEIFTAARHFPEGRLDDFQRHKSASGRSTTWAGRLRRRVDVRRSGVIDSGTTYSLCGGRSADYSASRCDARRGGLSGRAGEPDGLLRRARRRVSSRATRCVDLGWRPTTSRCSERCGRTSNFDIYNAFNNQKLIRWNTTVSQDPTTPVDENRPAHRLPPGRELRQGHGEHALPDSVDRRNRRPDVALRRRLPVLVRVG